MSIRANTKINEEKLRKRIVFEPHPDQLKVIEAFNNKREVLLRCGRRWGKSMTCAYLATREALYPNKVIWLVAPTYDLSTIVFDIATRFLSKVLSEKNYSIIRKPSGILKLANGSIIQTRSAENPASLLGRSTDLVILDEAARLNKDIWDEYIYPTTHERKGKVAYISTPVGKNWFYDKELELQESGTAFHFPSNSNPHFLPEEWERAKKSVNERVFRNMYLAEYADDKDSVFAGVDNIIEDCIKEPEPNHFYSIGVDIGRRVDPTVIMIMNRNTHRVVHILELKCDFPLQKQKIKNLSKRYNNAKIILESTGVGDPILSDFRAAGVFVEEFRTAGHNKMQLIDKLSLFIEEKAIKIPDNEKLIEQLKWFEATVPESGYANYVKYSAPRGKSDDYVMALALAVWDLPTYTPSETPTEDDLFLQHRAINKIFNEYD